MPGQKNSRLFRTTLVCFVLAVMVLAVYGQSRNFDFINLDDPLYVTRNPHVQQGLCLKSIGDAFTTLSGEFWLPVTVLSLMVDHELYGLNAGGYHMTNVFLHLLNSILLFLFLGKATGSFLRSAFAAAVFALHPMFTESVIWIAERKDVLSLFFLLLTLLVYRRYSEKKSAATYMGILACFSLGLMAKPMLVTLPCALLLLDFWPLQRTGTDRTTLLEKFAPLVIEKIPLFVLSLIFSIITFITQGRGQAVVGLDVYPLSVRISNALVSYVRYLKKFILPCDLAVFYPHPLDTIPLWQILVSVLVLMLITLTACRTAKKQPFFIFGWLWFLGILFPVIGLTQSGLQAMADRFIYIPAIGLIIMISWGVPAILGTQKYRNRIIGPAAVLYLLLLGMAAWIQAGYWQNSIRLFTHAVRTTENNYIAHTCLANAYQEAGCAEPAYRHYVEALRIKPNYAKAHYNLGLLLAKNRRTDDAIKHFRLALKVRPEKAETHNALAIALAEKNELNKAITHFREAVRRDPGFADAQNNLGHALMLSGKISEAITVFETLLKDHPDHAFARNNLKKAVEKSKKRNKKD